MVQERVSRLVLKYVMLAPAASFGTLNLQAILSAKTKISKGIHHIFTLSSEPWLIFQQRQV
jgi:hypothetical protein